MIPLRRILCPTDFSDPSNEALKIANELARHFSSEVVLLHVLQPMRSSVTTEPHTGFDLFAYQESTEIQATGTRAQKHRAENKAQEHTHFSPAFVIQQKGTTHSRAVP